MPKQYTPTPIAERLLRHAERQPNGCLFWTGYVSPSTGYGHIQVAKKPVGVHTVAYREWIGPIPIGHQVHHQCDVLYAPGDPSYRRCFEPLHLTTGTGAENSQHMTDSGRAAIGARNGAHLHPDRLPRGVAHHAHTKPESMPKGERHGCAKLTDQRVRQARIDYAAGGIRIVDLARREGVSISVMHAALTGETWKHVH